MTGRAAGFVQRHVSSAHTDGDAATIRKYAGKLEYTWVATFFADTENESNHVRLLNQIRREFIDAIFLPSAAHLDERDIDVLASHVDVYCVAEGRLYTTLPEGESRRHGATRVVEVG